MKMSSFLTISALMGMLASSSFAGVDLYDDTPVTLDSRESVAISTGAWVPMLQQGTRELMIGGRIDWEDFDDLEYSLRFSYGYFFRDGWELGITGSFEEEEDVRNLSLGLFTEYNFNRDSQWVPFVGFSAEWAGSDFDELDDADGDTIQLGGELGVKYFLRPYMAISGSIKFFWAADEIYAVDDALEDSVTTLFLGMRFYY